MNTEIISREELARMIDHSLLKPTLTLEDTRKGLDIAVKYRVASATIKPCYTRLAAKMLQKSGVKVNPVICFPMGYETTETKVFATRQAIDEGAEEIDMVMNLGAFLGGEYDFVQEDIASVVFAAQDVPVKVIFETGYFTSNEQIVKACQISESAGVAFVKTSSGFAPSPFKDKSGESIGYTLEMLKLMRASVSAAVQVKAAQGVRCLADALEVRSLGVTRFGASRTEKIFKEWEETFG